MNAKELYAFSVLFLAVLTSLLGIGIVVPFLPKILSDLGSSGLIIGAILGGFSVTRFLGMPFAGYWGDRYGRKLLLIIATLGYLLTAVGYVLARDNYLWIGIVRIMNGLVASISMPVAMAYAGSLTPRSREGFTMGIFNLSIFTGFGSGPLVGGFLYDRYGYEMVFYAMGALSAVALVMLLFLPEQKGKPERLSMWDEYKKILGKRVILAIFLHRVILSAGRAAAMGFLPILAVDEWRISTAYVGIILTSQMWLVNFLQPVFGWVADRANRIAMIIIGSLGATLLFFLIPHTGSFPLLLAVCIGIGMFGSVSIPASTAIAVTEGRSLGMAKVMAFFNMGMPLGHAIGFILTGWIMDVFGIVSLFYFSGVIGVIGVAIFIFLVYGSKGKGPPVDGSGTPIDSYDVG